jgi:hypothetical protein
VCGDIGYLIVVRWSGISLGHVSVSVCGGNA